ncbi:MAG: DegT/DnrJ/EryC1/StrS family aminotransferase, partial [Bacteroidales bacterium]|nr:DegT/DnrJ/EryC1/StrS family aminotransferase [Bacteroidales bacterium]
SNYWRLRSFYRFLSKHNLVVGSSQGEELTGTKMPEGYFKSISEVQVKKGISNLDEFDTLMKRRHENAVKYSSFLKEHHKYYVDEQFHKDHCFLKYPILVKDRTVFEELAFNAKIELGDWFCTPLYPVKDNWIEWDLHEITIPIALYLSKHIVNLPTETKNPEKVIKFVKNNIDQLI